MYKIQHSCMFAILFLEYIGNRKIRMILEPKIKKFESQNIVCYIWNITLNQNMY